MNCSFLIKAAPVAVIVAFLAATVGASSFVSVAPLPSDLLSSLPFLWIAANVIIIWLVTSNRHHKTAGTAVAAAMDNIFPSSEHDVFAASLDAVVAPVLVSVRQPREAKTAKRPADRPRVRKKSADEAKPPAAIVAEAKPMPIFKKERSEEEKPTAATATASMPDDTEDVSMDSAWQSIVRSGVARPVVVRKSETWGGEELPRMRRTADKAVAARKEMRKSASMVPPSPPHPSAASSSSSSPIAAKQGWRTRDVLVMAHDELLRRAESFIRRQHEHLRIQRQESDQRKAMEQDHRPRAHALIRV
jgi:hypothetical protein